MRKRLLWKELKNGFFFSIEQRGRTVEINTKPLLWKDLKYGLTRDYPISISKKARLEIPPLKWRDLVLGFEYDIGIIDSGEEEPKDKRALTDLFREKVTIYNDIPKTTLEERHFDRFVIEKCHVQGGTVTKQDGTIQNVVNAKTVITKDTARYKEPSDYYATPVDQRENFFTAKSGDIVIFREVEDVVQTAAEFAQLVQKYRDESMRVNSVSVFKNGMSVDNVAMQSV